jgi:MscS family membrane protein
MFAFDYQSRFKNETFGMSGFFRQRLLPLWSLLVMTVFFVLLLGTAGAKAETSNGSQSTSENLQARVEQARLYLRDNPISPPDTTSPRATVESFLFIMQEVNAQWYSARQDYENSNRFFSTKDQREKLVLVQALLEKAAQTFDLSDIPVTSREGAGVEIALQLQEILDRIPKPNVSDIPGHPAGGFMHAAAQSDLPERWTIPSTSISVIRQETGEQQGHYLFSKDTVNRIPDDYAVVKTLPLQADRGEDLFEYFIYTPGNLVAPRWYDLIKAGPDWLHNSFADQAYWQWLGLFALLAVYAIGMGYYIRWQRLRAVSISERKRVLRSIANPAFLILSAAIFRYLCVDQINITGTPLVAIGTVTTAIIWSAIAWLVYQFLQILYIWFIRIPGAAQEGLDASLLRTGYRVFSMAVALVVLGYGATQIGIPIYGVIAGLGVGGLAIALAAQPTIENLIGGIILYADRMVRIGEFCQFDDLAGTIESIGIRSTRIRAKDRTIITIANADLAKRKIINFSYRDQFHFNHKFGLRYETSSNDLKKILSAIHDHLNDHEKVLQNSLRVRLIGFDEYAVTIEANAYVSAPANSVFLEIQEQLLFDIRDILKTNGSDFAFPSSTVYLSRDSALPTESPLEENNPSSDEDSQAA